LRVIYIHIPDLRVLYLLDVYSKDEADDLAPSEKALLRQLARTIVEELRKRQGEGRL